MEKPEPLGTKETVSLPLIRYRDKDGNPACASDFENGRVCIFYGTQHFGTHETCWFAVHSGPRWGSTERRKQGVGTLIPIPNCPLWIMEEISR